MHLHQLTSEHRPWLEANFPNQTAEEALLGVVEEVGELSHAHLKGNQGIRHTPAEIREMKIDAIGDIVIFLDGYCIGEGLDFDSVVAFVWAKVKQRDWLTNKETGGEDVVAT